MPKPRENPYHKKKAAGIEKIRKSRNLRDLLQREAAERKEADFSELMGFPEEHTGKRLQIAFTREAKKITSEANLTSDPRAVITHGWQEKGIGYKQYIDGVLPRYAPFLIHGGTPRTRSALAKVINENIEELSPKAKKQISHAFREAQKNKVITTDELNVLTKDNPYLRKILKEAG